MAKITLFGMEHWMQNERRSLFDSLQLPTGMDKDTFVDSLLVESGEFAVLYSDPDFLQHAIGTWSIKNALTFKKWFDAWNAEYNPINNYDMKEESNDSDSGTHGRHEKVRSDQSNDTSTTSGVTSNNRNVNNVSAYDEAGFSPHDEQLGNVSENSLTSGNSKGISEDERDESESHSSNHQHTLNRSGNIGVTSSQQLLESEMQLREKYNPYDLMINDFTLRFLVPVYD